MTFIIFTITWCAVVVWTIRCIHVTGEQRMELIDAIHHYNMSAIGQQAPPISYNALDAVSFDKHFNCLVTFRDPWKLYPPSLRNKIRPFMKGSRS